MSAKQCKQRKTLAPDDVIETAGGNFAGAAAGAWLHARGGALALPSQRGHIKHLTSARDPPLTLCPIFVANRRADEWEPTARPPNRAAEPSIGSKGAESARTAAPRLGAGQALGPMRAGELASAIGQLNTVDRRP